jgi:hypothetical protein
VEVDVELALSSSAFCIACIDVVNEVNGEEEANGEEEELELTRDKCSEEREAKQA